MNYADSAQPGHAFATAPGQVISYCECHDNHTLYDKLAIANPGSSEEERKDMHRLALSIILTSQGIPFRMPEQNSFEASKAWRTVIKVRTVSMRSTGH